MSEPMDIPIIPDWPEWSAGSHFIYPAELHMDLVTQFEGEVYYIKTTSKDGCRLVILGRLYNQRWIPHPWKREIPLAVHDYEPHQDEEVGKSIREFQQRLQEYVVASVL